MKILVTAKRVIDPYVNVCVKANHSGVRVEGVKHTINPFDEIAVEEAIRLKEKGHCTEVIAVSIGSTQSQDTLRHALALGADRAIHVESPVTLEPLTIAKALRVLVLRETPSLVFLGKQAIDDDSNQVGQMLAALLDWPQVTFASQVTYEDQHLIVTREVDGGLETVHVTPPVVITADLRLNTPRYATLPNIIKARQKPLISLTLDDLAIANEARLTRLSVNNPPPRKKGILLTSASELIERLDQEGFL